MLDEGEEVEALEDGEAGAIAATLHMACPLLYSVELKTQHAGRLTRLLQH